jgi:hypothetical protein
MIGPYLSYPLWQGTREKRKAESGKSQGGFLRMIAQVVLEQIKVLRNDALGKFDEACWNWELGEGSFSPFKCSALRKSIENRGFYGSTTRNAEGIILTFILTLNL